MLPSQTDTPVRDADAGSQPALAGVAPALAARTRPEVHGKFFRVGDDKLYLRGVTYGPFGPGRDGVPYDPGRTREDFAHMAHADLVVDFHLFF